MLQNNVLTFKVLPREKYKTNVKVGAFDRKKTNSNVQNKITKLRLSSDSWRSNIPNIRV